MPSIHLSMLMIDVDDFKMYNDNEWTYCRR